MLERPYREQHFQVRSRVYPSSTLSFLFYSQVRQRRDIQTDLGTTGEYKITSSYIRGTSHGVTREILLWSAWDFRGGDGVGCYPVSDECNQTWRTIRHGEQSIFCVIRVLKAQVEKAGALVVQILPGLPLAEGLGESGSKQRT